MARKARHVELAEQIKNAISEIESLEPSLSKPAATKARAFLASIKDDVERAISSLDPVRVPATWFDPADPESAGRLVAAALLAQPRVPLDLISRSYGAGVYAIYYNGDHPVYAGIRRTETPIYVGKADPQSASARTPREQGEKLYGRLTDHRKMIRTVESYASENEGIAAIKIEDFECRRLVTATNAQMFAETHLITLFHPIWNKESRICWGISKHGDTEGRNNARSPWDVLHPGRKWAMAEKLEDSRPREQIVADVKRHITDHLPFKDRDEVIELLLEGFAQDPMTAAAPVDEDAAPEDMPSDEKLD